MLTNTATVEWDKERREVPLADTFISRAIGLRFNTTHKHMLFDAGRYTSQTVDMAFVRDPLYLYFLDKSGLVLDIKYAQEWTYNPKTWQTYAPDNKFYYLFESFEKISVSKGEEIFIH